MWKLFDPTIVNNKTTLPFQEIGINTQLLMENSYLRGKIWQIWGVEQLIYEMAGKYGLDYDFHKAVINCECNLKKDHETCIGDSGLAFGRVQFHEATFRENCLGDYKNEEDQLNCYGQMMSKGKGRNWSCYTNLIKTLTDK